MNSPIDRREFLSGVAALAATSIGASLTGCRSTQKRPESAHVPITQSERGALSLLLTEADGSPLDHERLRTLHARDLHNDPVPQPIVTSSGRARIELNPDEPIQISLRLKVPGFGEVYCYADKDGEGYHKPQTVEFVIDAARTRLRRVRRALDEHPDASVDQKFHEHLTAAARPIPNQAGLARTVLAYESLSHGLHAGEMLALAIARDRIRRFRQPRQAFKFGILASGAGQRGPVFDQRIGDLFNFATASWYTWRDEQFADTDPVDYARMDQSIDWCLRNGISPKGFGYLYMIRGATPEWIRPIEQARQRAKPPSTRISTLPNSEPSTRPRQFNPNWDYGRIKSLYARIIRSTMARYDGRIDCAEIMNEAHDKANLWGLSHEQILDMAKMAFDAARQGSKTVRRQMNHCCMWAEYAKHRNPDGSRRWSPWQFVKACFDHGIDYEIIGLQLYYPQNDLFEIDRMLERFLVFNKTLHITEMSTASQDGLDPHSMRPHSYAPGWHGPWSPQMQADWAEGIYTLCYSKPAVEEVGWWDFTDQGGHFWPFGGLLNADFTPKPAYLRLQALQREWGLAKV
jgi:hypothetical protein